MEQNTKELLDALLKWQETVQDSIQDAESDPGQLDAFDTSVEDEKKKNNQDLVDRFRKSLDERPLAVEDKTEKSTVTTTSPDAVKSDTVQLRMTQSGEMDRRTKEYKMLRDQIEADKTEKQDTKTRVKNDDNDDGLREIKQKIQPVTVSSIDPKAAERLAGMMSVETVKGMEKSKVFDRLSKLKLGGEDDGSSMLSSLAIMAIFLGLVKMFGMEFDKFTGLAGMLTRWGLGGYKGAARGAATAAAKSAGKLKGKKPPGSNVKTTPKPKTTAPKPTTVPTTNIADDITKFSDEAIETITKTLQNSGDEAAKIVAGTIKSSGDNAGKLVANAFASGGDDAGKAIATAISTGGDDATKLISTAFKEGGDSAAKLMAKTITESGTSAGKVVGEALKFGGESAAKGTAAAIKSGGDDAAKAITSVMGDQSTKLIDDIAKQSDEIVKAGAKSADVLKNIKASSDIVTKTVTETGGKVVGMMDSSGKVVMSALDDSGKLLTRVMQTGTTLSALAKKLDSIPTPNVQPKPKPGGVKATGTVDPKPNIKFGPEIDPKINYEALTPEQIDDIAKSAALEGGDEIVEQASKAGSKMAKEVGEETAKVAAKQGGKIAGGMASKLLPGVGATVAATMATIRFNEGDYFGAALDVTSGAASFIPGVGTALALAIDAGHVYLDLSEDGQKLKAYINRLGGDTEEMKAFAERVAIRNHELQQEMKLTMPNLKNAQEIIRAANKAAEEAGGDEYQDRTEELRDQLLKGVRRYGANPDAIEKIYKQLDSDARVTLTNYTDSLDTDYKSVIGDLLKSVEYVEYQTSAYAGLGGYTPAQTHTRMNTRAGEKLYEAANAIGVTAAGYQLGFERQNAAVQTMVQQLEEQGGVVIGGQQIAIKNGQLDRNTLLTQGAIEELLRLEQSTSESDKWMLESLRELNLKGMRNTQIENRKQFVNNLITTVADERMDGADITTTPTGGSNVSVDRKTGDTTVIPGGDLPAPMTPEGFNRLKEDNTKPVTPVIEPTGNDMSIKPDTTSPAGDLQSKLSDNTAIKSNKSNDAVVGKLNDIETVTRESKANNEAQLKKLTEAILLGNNKDKPTGNAINAPTNIQNNYNTPGMTNQGLRDWIRDGLNPVPKNK